MLRSLGDVSRLPRQHLVQSGSTECHYSKLLGVIVSSLSSEALTCSRSQGPEDKARRHEVPTAHGSSSALEQGTHHHGQVPYQQEQVSDEFTRQQAEHIGWCLGHAPWQRQQSHDGQPSLQSLGCLAHMGRSSSSSDRVAQQSRAYIKGSRCGHGIAVPSAAALLRHRQRPAGSVCCSARGFASMPYTASHRDSQPDRGTTTCSARGFASASETAQQSAAAAAEPPQQAFVPPGRVQNAPAAPWTPTRELRKRNFLPRRMGHLMEVLDREAQEKAADRKKFPDFEAGDLLELTLGVPENKGREAKVRGICMAKRRRGYRTSFTLLNHIPGGGPVERSFPLYSPTLQSIKVLGRRKVRRAKLYYLRDRKPSEYKV